MTLDWKSFSTYSCTMPCLLLIHLLLYEKVALFQTFVASLYYKDTEHVFQLNMNQIKINFIVSVDLMNSHTFWRCTEYLEFKRQFWRESLILQRKNLLFQNAAQRTSSCSQSGQCLHCC